MENRQLTALVGGIQKFSTEDGPGIRTTVFLKGCPLDCGWCHNPELIEFKQQIIEMPNSCIKCGYCLSHCPETAIYLDNNQKICINRSKCDLCLECTDFCYAQALQTVAKEMGVKEVMAEVLQDKNFYDNTKGGMTISGGEILSQGEFVKELVDRAFIEDIGVCLDTSGFGDGNLLCALAKKNNVTNILYDMKSIDDDIHKKYTGQSNKVILENLINLTKDENTRDKIQMRMPLIKGINDTDKIIKETALFYIENGIKHLTLLPYHNLGVSKKRNIGGKPVDFETPTDEVVEKIKKYFEINCKMNVEILGKL